MYDNRMPYQAQNPYASLYNGLQQYQAPKYEIIRVNGEAGVDMLPVAARSNLLALDQSRSDILLAWYIQTDDGGYKTKTPYVLTPYVPEAPKNDFEERLSRLEAIVNEQSAHADVKPVRSDNNSGKNSKQ